jgi:hypothetical protein
MLEGLSTNRRCEASADCLAAEGKRFVFRYHSRTTTQAEKRLHPREAALLARAGIAIATVYQDRATTLADFGRARGEQDAVSALVYAGQVGQPAGSAVYFAVDGDFSAAQIRQAIVPYFRSIDAAFRAAGRGTAQLKIGVYGSGLACRLIGALDFVAFRWLAESPGWRESATYDDWHVRQHRNTGQTLCSLGNAFERCEARDDGFGQFRPVGFDVRAGQGEIRRVVADGGNLRNMPSTVFNEPIAFLPGSHELRVLGASAPGWLRIRTALGGAEVIGHVAESRIAPVAAPVTTAAAVVAARPGEPLAAPVPALPALPAAQLREDNADANRHSTSGRAYPIGEAARKTRSPSASASERVAQLVALADWLDVERSIRYARTPRATFCNVYAADYCYLAAAYLPRVWWTDSALLRLGRGETVAVLYAETVREMRADDLFAWLVDMGLNFGWRRVFDATALQEAANGGGVGLICADRAAEGLPGHISVVVPEANGRRATRDADGNVTQPLQTQAGASNFRFGSAGASWWSGSVFRDRGFFVHD